MAPIEKLAIVIPLFNDWESALHLLENLSKELKEAREICDVEIFFVNDGSSDPTPDISRLLQFGINVQIVGLPLNVGHQRAILAGIRSILPKGHSHVLVMDADGEDTPEGVLKLIFEAQKTSGSIVVAQRGLRAEGIAFRIMYSAHKTLFRLLVGKRLDFGNFAILPAETLGRLVTMAESSSHFPSTILRSNAPLTKLKITRGARYFGKSQMNFEKLVAHSFASLAVFTDQIMVRIMILSFATTVITTIGIAAVVTTRFLDDSVTPGWATAAAGLLFVVSLQILTFAGLGTLISLNLTSLKNFYWNQVQATTRQGNTSRED
jgi:glycosyltransferase involved in cell wall biosynthesis